MLASIVTPLLLAAILSSVLVGGLGWRRPGRADPGAAVVFSFLIFFFGLWAVAVWVEPVGPVLWNVAWIPLIVAGLVLALLVAITTPPRRVVSVKLGQGLREETINIAGLSSFFWVLLGILFVAAAVGTWAR
jgi:hypothetical protein